ncbi:MAG: DUF305 domain-containing protein [Microbacteriaceae bacterium]|nr:DUF305 domain-containing protein [Microbacteriaceae bacterium]
MNKLVAPIALSAVLALSLGGCSSDLFGFLNQGGETQAEKPTTVPGSTFDMNDVMFAQMMIPHHSQAVELAALAEANTTTAAILDLAARIKGAQQPEIDTMTAWLAAAGSSAVDHGSHGMSMPGMVSDADMAMLEQATGAEFDALFLAHMIQHHEGAIDMANDVLATTANDEVAALATAIVAAQTAEIAEMTGLLGP